MLRTPSSLGEAPSTGDRNRADGSSSDQQRTILPYPFLICLRAAIEWRLRVSTSMSNSLMGALMWNAEAAYRIHLPGQDLVRDMSPFAHRQVFVLYFDWNRQLMPSQPTWTVLARRTPYVHAEIYGEAESVAMSRGDNLMSKNESPPPMRQAGTLRVVDILSGCSPTTVSRGTR